MSVESYIKEYVPDLCDRVFVAPEIPEKKLNSAISAIANGVDPNHVIAIADTSVFGNAKDGCVFLGDAVYIRGMLEKPNVFRYEAIVKAEYKYSENVKDNGKIDKKEEVFLYLSNEELVTLTSSINGIHYERFADLINGIIETSDNEKDYVSTSQTLPLALMDEEVKVAYIKLVCNFTYSDDGIIDSKEYAEITSLIVRVELQTKKRLELRNYMCDISNIENNDELLRYIFDNVPEGSIEIVKKSLIKDILYIFRLNNDAKLWSENLFILELCKKLNIDDNQVNLILDAIQSDEDILKQRKNDSEIIKAMKELAAKAGAVGVPMAAIYFSGSVIGLGATGITSGLAALGMGGILGLSGMVTGIGAALLIGVTAYQGIKKVTGISDLENNKQRELMLQTIIRNSQKSLNYLIEDVNEISKQLMEEVKKGVGTSRKIEKMSNLLEMLSKGAQQTVEKITHAEIETIMTQIPRKLDIVRLQELTHQPTKEKLRIFILSCYIETEFVNEEGSTQKRYILDDQLILNKLERLYEVFDSIGYLNVKDAALASVKGAAKSFVKNLFE